MKLDALDHPKTRVLRYGRYPDERYMDLIAYPVLPVHLRVPRPKQDIWQALKSLVHQRSGYVCFYCGRGARPHEVCDHLLPLSRGGTHHQDNLVTACDPCNAAKGMLTAEEFSKKRAA